MKITDELFINDIIQAVERRNKRVEDHVLQLTLVVRINN